MPFDLGQRLVEFAAGVYIESDTLRVVQAIQEYDPNLRVKYLDPDRGGELDDPPYKIYEVCPDGFERLVFSVWSLDGRVLERLYDADTQKFDVLQRLTDNNNLVRERDKQRYKEEVVAEAHDLAVHVIKHPRTTYRIPGPDGTVYVIDSHRPVELRTRSGQAVERHEVIG